ncbi:predicted protein [Nematostella vectensis]|uniref:G-protein coupled receptors family 1 profile domain-containing protein n=1 Tax=Nematostella vectensis TaxID=45351 RepID=A7SNZ3_NEMVE|nr:predicted protein [Nematostella vectensis]|eukprot:XP_001626685.1 predicted protein [Nematostella vectensis]
MNNTTFGQGWIPFDVFQAIYISEGCVVTVANAISIIVLLRKSFRTKKSTFFVVSMTVADLQMKFGKTFDNEQASRKNAKLAKTLSIVTLTTLACYLPYTIYLAIYGLRTSTWATFLTLSVFQMLLLSNSFWNVLVYSIRMPEFRTELCNLARQCAIYTSRRRVRAHQYDRSCEKSEERGNMSRDNPAIVLDDLASRDTSAGRGNMSRDSPAIVLGDLVSRDTYTERGNMSRDNPAIVLGDLTSRDTYAERSNISRDNCDSICIGKHDNEPVYLG